MLPRILKAQGGFTLIELLAVIAILTVLSGIVAGAVTGIGASGQNARLAGDSDTIGKAADRFFNDAFPQAYPVLPLEDPDGTGPLSGTPEDIRVAGDLGVRLVNFEAVLPGDPKKAFVPDFLKEVPDTAALVSWRIVTATGQVFFAQDGAQLVRPSNARLDVSANNTTMSTPASTGVTAVPVTSDYKFKLRLNKNEAAPTILGISIPAGYAIGGQALLDNVTVGTLTVTLSTDNPWDAGQVLTFTDNLVTTGSPNEWELDVNYKEAGRTVGTPNTGATAVTRANRTHKVSIAPPSEEAAGALKIELKTCGLVSTLEVCDKAHNQATETWELTIYGGKAGTGSTALTTPTAVITNPSVKGVYRWLAAQHTTIDVGTAGQELFSSLAGNQAVVIKAATTTTVTVDTTAPAAPTGLTATSGAAGSASIILDWADNTESDLAGYNVYRSTTAGSGHTKINSSLVIVSAYTDSTTVATTTYYYVVKAVDNTGNESAASSEASAVGAT